MTRKSSPAMLALAVAAMFAGAAQAEVIKSLPYPDTPDWTDILFDSTSMDQTDRGTVLTTQPFRGVWFGWGVWYSNRPTWDLGNSVSGNALRMKASFSAGAADWSAYMYDGQHYAAFVFNPTGCTLSDCYSFPAQVGVDIAHAKDGNPAEYASTFIPLDTTRPHVYEYQLKNGKVSYKIDGQLVYRGKAYASSPGAGLLVIGDGSGPTGTGVGSMTVHHIKLNTAPGAE